MLNELSQDRDFTLNGLVTPSSTRTLSTSVVRRLHVMEIRSEFAESAGESEEDDSILEVVGAKVEATGGHAGAA